jgi:hypothetical protein
MLPDRWLLIFRFLFVVYAHLFEVRDKFLLACYAYEVVADHFECSLCRLPTGPKIDSQACDNRTVNLDRYSVLAVAD